MSASDEFDGGMYDVEDFELPVKTETVAMTASVKGSIVEIDIAGKKVEVVSPQYVKDTQRITTNLFNQIRDLENTVRQLTLTVSGQTRVISDLQRQLNGKIDRG